MPDTYLCKCGPCRGFWKGAFQEHADLLAKSAIHRSVDTSIMMAPVLNRENHPAVLKVGDRVVVKGKHKGVIKFIGLLDEKTIAPKTYVGVHLDENGTNGIYKNKRYFHVPWGHGAMVKYSDVRLINPPDHRPPIYGNPMFPSYDEIKARREAHSARSQDKGKGHDKQASTEICKQEEKPANFQDDKRKDQAQKLRQEFGGGKRADRMMKTLGKLRKGYKLGSKVTQEEQCDYSDDSENEL